MREIKFRAWYRLFKKMIFLKDYCNDDYGWFFKSVDTKLMQYTGLKDKKGREIYEEDLVRFEVLYERIGKVIISPTRLELFDGNEYWGVYEDEDLEVIGNIYENPELLAVNNRE